jgi:predicted MPP superfamily phosphohydrolase
VVINPVLASQVFDFLLAAVVFLGAAIGHIALMMLVFNVMFGMALSRRFLSWMRKLHVLLIIPSPLLFFFGFGFQHGIVLQPYPDTLCCPFLWVYTTLCWTFGFGILPFFTVKRLLARRPAVLLSNHGEVLDVAQQLGYKPEGDGKYHYVTTWPGNQVFQVEFAERELRLARLPAVWDGLTILHLTDLHFCGTPDREFYRLVVSRCRAWEPDLVAVTGDIVDSDRHHRWIIPLLGRLRWQVAAFAILGNHDYWHDPNVVRRRLRRIGMRVLPNKWEQLEVRGRPLVVIGHEGPWFRPAPDLSACPSDAFRLCLSHTPDNIRWAQRANIDLMLSGHNHGGQIRLPLFGSMFVPSLYSRRYDCGTFLKPPTVLYVSRGLAGKHPLRINCRPEVTRLVLRKQT